jgi:transcriptional regulator with XRE-family HTH domain
MGEKGIELDTFAGRFKYIRNKLKLTQKEFAKTLNMSHQAVSGIESGKSKAGSELYYNLISMYDVNINFLLFGKGKTFGNERDDNQIHMPEELKNREDIKDFLRYFFTSPIVQYRILGDFRKLMMKENHLIEMELEQEELKKK